MDIRIHIIIMISQQQINLPVVTKRKFYLHDNACFTKLVAGGTDDSYNYIAYRWADR